MQKKTIYFILTCIFALTMALTGCGANTDEQKSSSANNDGKIHLTYWYSWKDKIAENNIERIKEFNETIGKENGIEVTAEYQGTYDDLHSKLQSAFVANEEPDVTVMEIASIKPFADGGMIQSLDGLIPEEDVKDFYPGLMENCYVDGKLYGVPYLRSTPVLYYNKTLFEKAGLNPEEGPKNWEELVSFSKQLASAGVNGLGIVPDIWHYEALLRCNGGDTVNNTWTEATFNAPQGVQMATYLRNGVKENNFKYYSGSTNSTADVIKADEVNQKIAMWIASTADLSKNLELAKENGYEIGTAFIPKNTQNKVPTGGCNLVMTSRVDGAKKEAAIKLIQFMTSKDNAVKNHIKTGYLLTRQSDINDSRIEELYKNTPQYKVALDQLVYGSGRPMAQGYKEVSKLYVETMDKIMTTDIDIAQTLNELAQKCNSLLTK